jgi:hypothetical protein
MYVGRRREDGDVGTFVVQTGEEGRFRLRVPDLSSDASIETAVAGAQIHLVEVLGAPVPLCPLHEHALMGTAAGGELSWVCPENEWRCLLGAYEELTWPQLDVGSLAPILLRRLRRRGKFPAVQTIGVRRSGTERVAEFGLVGADAELLKILSEVAAPLLIETHDSPDVMFHPLRARD